METGETCKGFTLIVPNDGGTFSGRISGTIEKVGMGTVIFRTDAPQYKWLERKVCVSEKEIKSWSELLTTVYMI